MLYDLHLCYMTFTYAIRPSAKLYDLHLYYMTFTSAPRYLKVEQLFRLGGGSRGTCTRLLDTLQWNLELASSVVIDQHTGRGRREGKQESQV